MLAINEIFYSLQGEGDYMGTPMVFVRVAGCNLACAWCDQPDTIHEGFQDRQGVAWKLKYSKMSEKAVLEEVLKYPAKRVCLTGGEPTIHKLEQLVGLLRGANKLVHVETNGTHCPEWLEWCNHVCVSPKREAQPVAGVLKLAKEMKFIVDAEFRIEEAEELRTSHFVGHCYLQPANGKDRWDATMMKKVIELCLKHPIYRMSMQLHKALGVR